jgi:hypothetical protein
VFQRDYGLKRCPDHGETGLARWVGWGIVTAHLERIARTLAERAADQSPTRAKRGIWVSKASERCDHHHNQMRTIPANSFRTAN